MVSGEPKEDAHLLAKLVDEDGCGLGLGETASDLAQRLGHQASLESDVGVSHLAFDLRPWHRGRDGVGHHDVQGPRGDQHVHDLQGLLTGVRLRDEQCVGVHSELLRVAGVQGMLGVDERRDAAGLLGTGHRMQCDGGLAGGLRAVDLHHSTPGEPPDAQGRVHGDGRGGDRLDRCAGLITQTHH